MQNLEEGKTKIKYTENIFQEVKKMYRSLHATKIICRFAGQGPPPPKGNTGESFTGKAGRGHILFINEFKKKRDY